MQVTSTHPNSDLSEKPVTLHPSSCGTSPTRRCKQRMHQQLNKGESLHALRRRLFFAHEGHIRRHHGEQTEQALCLTLVTNAVVLFNTVYLQKVLGTLRQDGHDVGDQAAAHLSPALHQHINVYGSYSFDVERELNRTGLRPLRDPANNENRAATQGTP